MSAIDELESYPIDNLTLSQVAILELAERLDIIGVTQTETVKAVIQIQDRLDEIEKAHGQPKQPKPNPGKEDALIEQTISKMKTLRWEIEGGYDSSTTLTWLQAVSSPMRQILRDFAREACLDWAPAPVHVNKPMTGNELSAEDSEKIIEAATELIVREYGHYASPLSMKNIKQILRDFLKEAR